jgi:hypothetical protein
MVAGHPVLPPLQGAPKSPGFPLFYVGDERKKIGLLSFASFGRIRSFGGLQ